MVPLIINSIYTLYHVGIYWVHPHGEPTFFRSSSALALSWQMQESSPLEGDLKAKHKQKKPPPKFV